MFASLNIIMIRDQYCDTISQGNNQIRQIILLYVKVKVIKCTIQIAKNWEFQ